MYVGQRVETTYINKQGGSGLIVGKHEDGRWNVLVSQNGKVFHIPESQLVPGLVEDRFGISPVYVLNHQQGITKAVFWGNLGSALVVALITLAIYLLNTH
jgi:hypothetical protein